MLGNEGGIQDVSTRLLETHVYIHNKIGSTFFFPFSHISISIYVETLS